MTMNILYAVAVLFTAISANIAGTQDINVVSFNMNGSDANVAAVAEMVKDESPAIIGIVECPDNLRSLKAALPDYDAAGKGSNQIFYLRGSLTAGNVEKVGPKTIKVSFTVTDSGRTFDVFNAVIGKADGVEPARQILDATADGTPSIILCTVNASPAGTFGSSQTNPNVILRQKYSDGRYSSISTDETPSLHRYGEGKGSTIDFIYYSPEFLGMHFRVLSKSYAGVEYMSDHYPIRDIIRFKN